MDLGRFQPTYEELKRFSVALGCPTPACFQPTYEELKLYCKAHFGYEEPAFPAYL